MDSFEPARVQLSWTQEIDAPAEHVFPLLCPVREREWIEGWVANLVYSESGFAEKDCIFETDMPHTGRALWVVSRHEPDRTVEFVVLNPGAFVQKLEIVLEEQGDRTSVRWRRIYTGLNPEGNRAIDGILPALGDRQTHVMEALEHFATTGRMLRTRR